MKKIICVVLVALTVLAMSIPALADYQGEDFKAKVIGENAVVYAAANTKNPVATLSRGKTVKVTGARGNWARVEKNGQTAYMRIKDLMSMGACKITATKKATNVYVVRGGSGVKTIPSGVTVYVYGKNESGYYLVGNKSMTKLGYIAKSAVI